MKAWFLNLSLSRKQLLTLITAGLVPTVIVSVLSFFMAKGQIQDQAFNQLESVRQIKSGAITRYIEQVESQIITLANSRGTIEAMESMAQSFPKVALSEELGLEGMAGVREGLSDFYTQKFGAEFSTRNQGEHVSVGRLHKGLSDSAAVLQDMYINTNANPLGEKHLLNMAQGESSYHYSHALHHPTFRQYLERFGFYDIFLVDAQSGDIVYSVFKELDYATSLLTGPYKDTNFSQAFKSALNLKSGEVTLEDFKTYLPSYNAPASFIATPVVQGGETIGVLVFQLPLEPINNIMGERTGMGESGETYLVGSDLLMRSDSFLDPVNHTVVESFKHPDKGEVNTVAVNRGVAGETGSSIITDYNGNPVLSSYAPLSIKGLNWVILAEIDVAEAFAGVYKLAYTAVAIGIVIALALVFSALYISKLITQPIIILSQSIQRVQERGDFTTRVDIDQNDEVGQTCQSFNLLLDNLSSAFSKITYVLDELGQGRCDTKIENSYSGDLEQLTRGVNNAASQIEKAKSEQEVQSQLALESAEKAELSAQKAQQQATETLIIKEALDVCDTSVMIADHDFNIIYLNHAVVNLMSGVESDIRQDIPAFSAKSLMGTNIDVFHKSPQHQRQMLSQLTEAYSTDLSISTRDFHLVASPIRSDKNEFLGAVIEWKDMTEELAKAGEEKRIADENARISQALDNSSTGTMIADKDHNIIYTNKSMMTLMVSAQGDMQEHIPGFDSQKIIGSNMNAFHKMNGNLKAEIVAGSSTFGITANPIKSDAGDNIGTVVEWVDRTEEVATEKEIGAIITAASKGDFSQKLELKGKTGFFHSVSSGLNQITSQTDTALNDTVRVLSALAEGDLTQTIDRDYEGGFARLKAGANQTISKLRDITDNIQQSSSTIARAADEISVGNADLSSRTENQASSLEETASSMEEITQTVLKSESNAEEATRLSNRSTSIAKEGYTAVEETSTAMEDISESSNRIVSIIGVIDEIAFQTNLLALNAAVEAARAGEQGRGFAVVAGEVRNLAQRSSSAAKEIKDLINDSQDKVSNGIQLVQNSKNTLNSIVTEIQKVSEIIAEVSSSAKEQSAGIEQVNDAVSQMDTMTQQNAALVEEASAASASMAEQAQSLAGLISFFKRTA